jgi:hypothetical protein
MTGVKPGPRPAPADTPRQKIDVAKLRALTARMPLQSQGAAEFIREMRDDSRY